MKEEQWLEVLSVALLNNFQWTWMEIEIERAMQADDDSITIDDARKTIAGFKFGVPSDVYTRRAACALFAESYPQTWEWFCNKLAKTPRVKGRSISPAWLAAELAKGGEPFVGKRGYRYNAEAQKLARQIRVSDQSAKAKQYVASKVWEGAKPSNWNKVSAPRGKRGTR